MTTINQKLENKDESKGNENDVVQAHLLFSSEVHVRQKMECDLEPL